MHVYIQSASPWLNDPLKTFILQHVPDSIFYDNLDDFPKDPDTAFQFCDGWGLNRNFAIVNSARKSIINAYPSSDAVARKNYLSRVVEYWAAKRPDSILKTNCPHTVCLSLDYAEYVDDALMAADDLSLLASLQDNEEKEAKDREWWILKPALVDCGAGIRLFSTLEELASHLELAEDEVDDDEEDEKEGQREEKAENKETKNEEDNQFLPSLTFPGLNSLDALITTVGNLKIDPSSESYPPKQPYIFKEGGRIPSSEMREFVAQRYITAIPPLDKRKWHVRAYILCIGRFKVHVFRDMLALLAGEEYEPPWLSPSLKASLTNTALQDEDDFVAKESMRDFWAIDDDLLPANKGAAGTTWKDDVFEQICEVTSELFCAAVHTMADRFTTLDKCFELFGVDFLVDDQGTPWLLEVNETPAFYQQGFAGELALRLMESVVLRGLEQLGVLEADKTDYENVRARMVQVLDESDKLGKSNINEILPEE